jgi:hypothetical protein
MPAPEWHRLPVPADRVLQGDQILGVPFEIIERRPGDERPLVHTRESDVVVLTQSCDIDEEANTSVLTARMVRLIDAIGSNPEQLSNLENIRKGYVPGLYLLPATALAPDFDEDRVVDLSELRTIDVAELRKAIDNGAPRLSLLSPQLEHFSQAVARSFMRVGLPEDLPRFVWRPQLGGADTTVTFDRLSSTGEPLVHRVEVVLSTRRRESDDRPITVATLQTKNEKPLHGVGRDGDSALESLEAAMVRARDEVTAGMPTAYGWVAALFEDPPDASG